MSPTAIHHEYEKHLLRTFRTEEGEENLYRRPLKTRTEKQ